jgi:5-methylcytosine-specific restriction endonuclease McrA
LDKIQVLEWYDDWTIRSAYLEMRVPAVAVTTKGFGKSGHMRFSRQNLYLRDLFQCQYCGDTFAGKHLTIDHVKPRSHGGKTSWDNCVTACKDCNSNKGSKFWRPLKEPYKPNYWNLVSSVKNTVTTVKHPSWAQYIGLKEEPIQVFRQSSKAY